MTLATNGLQNAVPYKWTFADSTARAAATGFVATDVGSWAVQLSDGTVWELTATTPTWAQRGGGSGAGMTNPMTTAGDIITGGASGTPQRLAVGTNTQVLTVVSGAPAWAAAGGSSSGARVYNSVAQSIPNNAWTALTFDSSRRDDASYHSNTTNNTRLTAPTAGWYALWVNVAIANTVGIRGVRLSLNGTTPLATQVTANANGASTVVASTLWYLNAADYVEMQAYQNSGGAVSTTIEADDTTEAAIVLLA